MAKTSVCSDRIKTYDELTLEEQHGRGMDKNAKHRRREDATHRAIARAFTA